MTALYLRLTLAILISIRRRRSRRQKMLSKNNYQMVKRGLDQL